MPCFYPIPSINVNEKEKKGRKKKKIPMDVLCIVLRDLSSSVLYPLMDNCAYVILASSVESRIIYAKASHLFGLSFHGMMIMWK